jgi:hypothetical protein
MAETSEQSASGRSRAGAASERELRDWAVLAAWVGQAHRWLSADAN